MMDNLLFGAATAVWLGILTSISPCPLATNIAAISFIGKNVGKPRYVLLAGLLYTIGRAVTYLILAAVIVAGLLSTPQLSGFLQNYMNKIVGPLLILVGMFLLDLFSINMGGFGVRDSLQQRIERYGIWGALLLGIMFALSLCPLSAVLFFGSFIPLSIEHHSSVALPALFGLGTALPVIVFAFILAYSAHSVGKAYNRLGQVELWARRITGTVFILAGIYYSLVNIFGVL